MRTWWRHPLNRKEGRALRLACQPYYHVMSWVLRVLCECTLMMDSVNNIWSLFLPSMGWSFWKSMSGYLTHDSKRSCSLRLVQCISLLHRMVLSNLLVQPDISQLYTAWLYHEVFNTRPGLQAYFVVWMWRPPEAFAVRPNRTIMAMLSSRCHNASKCNHVKSSELHWLSEHQPVEGCSACSWLPTSLPLMCCLVWFRSDHSNQAPNLWLHCGWQLGEGNSCYQVWLVSLVSAGCL